MESTKNDNVNHPSHYTDGKYECIDFIESWGLGFHLGNAVKYITRAGKKDPEKTKEDLEKALWYLKRFTLTQSTYRYEPTFDPIPVEDYCQEKHIPQELKEFVMHSIVYGEIRDAASYLDWYIHSRNGGMMQ